MKDELISYSTAVLAKEKGYQNGGDGFVIYKNDNIHPHDGTSGPFGWKANEIESCDYMVNNGIGDDSNKSYTCYERPTQSLLQRWLREVHNMHVVLHLGTGSRYISIVWIPDEVWRSQAWQSDYIDTYEEALEVGLQEALKLIEL